MKDNDGAFGFDKHADKRDRLRDKRRKDKAMRGDRKVFIIQEMLGKRAKQAREKGNK
jgi:hypothetical protein